MAGILVGTLMEIISLPPEECEGSFCLVLSFLDAPLTWYVDRNEKELQDAVVILKREKPILVLRMLKAWPASGLASSSSRGQDHLDADKSFMACTILSAEKLACCALIEFWVPLRLPWLCPTKWFYQPYPAQMSLCPTPERVCLCLTQVDQGYNNAHPFRRGNKLSSFSTYVK